MRFIHTTDFQTVRDVSNRIFEHLTELDIDCVVNIQIEKHVICLSFSSEIEHNKWLHLVDPYQFRPFELQVYYNKFLGDNDHV